ncbi:MAG TPA: hypothetical protein VH277_17255, partial [Gemmatimonadaceae bacterium]|nr:hypothetical protein [Gemmatimonadaceae bacterium]
SAHVTLGRALIEVGRLQDARGELEYVLKLAPENLAAIRGLAEIHHRVGQEASEGGSESVEDTAMAAPIVEQRQEPAPAAPAPIPLRVRVEEALAAPAIEIAAAPRGPQVAFQAAVDPTVAGLEAFLNAIVRARAARAGAR